MCCENPLLSYTCTHFSPLCLSSDSLVITLSIQNAGLYYEMFHASAMKLLHLPATNSVVGPGHRFVLQTTTCNGIKCCCLYRNEWDLYIITALLHNNFCCMVLRYLLLFPKRPIVCTRRALGENSMGTRWALGEHSAGTRWIHSVGMRRALGGIGGVVVNYQNFFHRSGGGSGSSSSSSRDRSLFAPVSFWEIIKHLSIWSPCK